MLMELSIISRNWASERSLSVLVSQGVIHRIGKGDEDAGG